MHTGNRTLQTRRGNISFPAYIPVTTYGDRYPLDRLIQPYLPRLAQGLMVSHHYALQMKESPTIPIFLDSGGFVSLFSNCRIFPERGLGVIELETDDSTELIHPYDVLETQEKLADVAFPLDFPIPPGTEQRDASLRMELTIANAFWALDNKRRRDLKLFAPVQAWDMQSARECARAYKSSSFDGIAIGGMVPRARDMQLVLEIVEAVRGEIGDLPLHVFGLGKPETVELLFDAGVDSVDSSSYVKMAADGRLWSNPQMRLKNPSVTDRLHLALCNLAIASGRALPLSASNLMFTTHSLDYHLAE